MLLFQGMTRLLAVAKILAYTDGSNSELRNWEVTHR